ncbi:MAG TPA: S24/S26 family peptidase [Candidatus Limnocylindrales bacterium]
MTGLPEARTVARLGLVESYRASGRTAWVEATGRSMGRSIEPSSRLLVEFGRVPGRRGEIVVFRRGESLIAHRAVALRRTAQGDRWIARGDDEAYLDPPLAASDVLGVVRVVRHADGRTEDVVPPGRRDQALAVVSWWSGRALGISVRALRRLPVPSSVRAAATRVLVHLSRVPNRAMSKAIPRASRASIRKEVRQMEYESPEIIASYSEEELTAEAAVSMQYGEIIVTPL